MREIKFRAWTGVRMVFRDLHDRNWYTESAAGTACGAASPRDARAKKVMQYTGLKDCNGVEVYEGDIVSVQYDVEDKTIHTVEWGGKSYPAFELMPQLDCECNGFAHYYEDPDTSLEVIGNIHENPELLE